MATNKAIKAYKLVGRIGKQPVEMPTGAEVMSARGGSEDELAIFCRVDPNEHIVSRTISLVDTEHPRPDDETGGKYIGNIQFAGTTLHVFDLG